MILFGILFAINVAVSLGVLAYFIIGLGDGTVTSFNILIWGAMLGVVFSVPGAAWLMRVRGWTRLAVLLLLPLALLAFAVGVFVLVMIANPPNWR